MKQLFLIPARGGSKGLPGKNIKPLAGKPLICYSIDMARKFSSDSFICVSSDDAEIIKAAHQYGLKVPFVRPSELATDTAGSWEVLLHALKYYEGKGITFQSVVLLQPTSPFRKVEDIQECLDSFSQELDMVVSVKEADANPYYNLFEENGEGYLYKSKTAQKVFRRQDAPVVYQYNGSVYVINVESVKKYTNFTDFIKIKKVVMSYLYSIDIDNQIDFEFCEFLLNKKYI